MIWETPEAMQAFRDTELAKSIPSAYGVIAAPDVDIHQMLFPLHQGVTYDVQTVVA